MRAYHTYLEACFIKVVDIFIDDTVFGLYICYKPELILDNLRIFV
jgi:hypothetical protein